jgi:hypothetical protein
VAALGAAIVFSSHALGDYGSSDTADNAAPAIRDLLAGDFQRFLADQPLMGSLSILVRLPFAALASAVGGGATLTYQLGALPCVVAPGLTGVLIGRRMRAAGRPVAARLLTIALCLLNPATIGALRAGHPEELLAAALCVAAVLLAADANRPLLAGALLGMAIGTKPWALVALAPVVLAAPASRLRVVAAVAVTAVMLTLPAPLASPQPFLAAAKRVGETHRVYPASAWWAVGSSRRFVSSDGVVNRSRTLRTLPSALSRSDASTLIAVVAAAIVLAFLVRRRGRASRRDAVGLLALLMLARCVLDPVPLDYYYAPALLALAAWEGLRREGLPVGTLLAAVAVAGILGPAPLQLGATTSNLLSLAVMATVGSYISHAMFAGSTAARASNRSVGASCARARMGGLR